MKNMEKFDLIIDYDQLELLFVMESPHEKEMETGVPCMKTTGERMAATLVGDKRIPFGQLLRNNDNRVLQYGIMNSFPFPLGMKQLLTPEQLPFARLKDEIPKWDSQTMTRDFYYEKHLDILHSINNTDSLCQFKERLNRYISKSPNLTTIVFCGYIAQSMFIEYYHPDPIPYNRYVSRTVYEQRSLRILFVNHPGNPDEKWHYKHG